MASTVQLEFLWGDGPETLTEPPPCVTEGCYSYSSLSPTSHILSTTGPEHFRLIAP